jgi:hypothetical protein
VVLIDTLNQNSLSQVSRMRPLIWRGLHSIAFDKAGGKTTAKSAFEVVRELFPRCDKSKNVRLVKIAS